MSQRGDFNSVKRHRNLRTLQSLFKNHPRWPHHKELFELVTKANLIDLRTSARFKELCAQLQKLHFDESSEEDNPDPLLVKHSSAPAIERQWHLTDIESLVSKIKKLRLILFFFLVRWLAVGLLLPTIILLLFCNNIATTYYHHH